MVRKIEKWLQDVYPGHDQIVKEYADLGQRELAIVAAGVLDVALADLIASRVVNCEKECEEFLGLNEDGRAPLGSIGARIQAAVLLGIISPADAEIIRCIKNIRNKFAHRVKVDFHSPNVRPLIEGLLSKFVTRVDQLVKAGMAEGISTSRIGEYKKMMDRDPKAGAGLLLIVFAGMHSQRHRTSKFMKRIKKVLPPRNWNSADD